ncbi:hypothetical protein [Caulobacter sp. 17J65-9]|uniref:hypothetical protein n=1 Tax=Caulobacter sp. 17J65-9 TaxID=2709382 RepID=UPI0013CC92F3|nr:hypothetical protein [Caulobacter sp. 17J65-9]NEX91886.1 hypothetical protein [Caulobacter sp. 17J65-9]
MIPTIYLGPAGDAPEFEILDEDLYPIVAMVIESKPALSDDEINSLSMFLALDTLHLDSEAGNLVSRFADVCQRILAEELVKYHPGTLTASDEFCWYLRPGCVGEGGVTPGVKDAAKRFLDFLAANQGNQSFERPRGEP